MWIRCDCVCFSRLVIVVVGCSWKCSVSVLVKKLISDWDVSDWWLFIGVLIIRFCLVEKYDSSSVYVLDSIINGVMFSVW